MASIRSSDFREESAQVEVLIAQARKLGEHGKKIRGSLGRTEEHAGNLRSLAGPAYNDTQSLQVLNRNVDLVLAEVARVKAMSEEKGDEEQTIRNNPRDVGLSTYLEALRRVEAKYQQLSNAPMRVNQEAQARLQQLLQYGARKLQQLFDEDIQKDNRPLEPLNYTTKNAPFPQMSGQKLAELRELNRFISSTQPRAGANLTTIQIYSNIRGQYLAASLQNMATGSTNIPKKKSENDLYRPGQSTINVYAQGIDGMFKAEWNNIVSVFNREECGIAFEMTTSRALNDYSKTLRDLNSQIKITITQDCFLAFEIIDVTNVLAYQMDSVTGQLKQQIRDLYKPLRDTAKASLVEMIEDIRRRVNGMVMLPPDGAAIAYTTEVLKRLQNLTNFRDSVASAMTSLGDGGWMTGQSSSSSSRQFDVGPDKDFLLAHYIADTLETLFSALEQRGLSIYKQKPIMGIFLANNVAVVDRMIRTSDLQPIVASNERAGPGAPSKIELWRKKAVNTYIDAWREPILILRDVQYTNRGRPASGGPIDSATIIKNMSGKDKDAYKEKFKTFNVLFESLCQKHKEMLPNMERDVRGATSREISQLVEPMYARFWDRYHEVDKGKGKYVRWDKAGITNQILNLG